MIKRLFPLLMLSCLASSAIAAKEDRQWLCESDISPILGIRVISEEEVELAWRGRRFRLQRQLSLSGAQRYFDEASGMDIVIIPAKLMLFNRKHGIRLADNCQIQSQLLNN